MIPSSSPYLKSNVILRPDSSDLSNQISVESVGSATVQHAIINRMSCRNLELDEYVELLHNCPEELAALIAFLASTRADYITGQSIPVDGGYIRGLI